MHLLWKRYARSGYAPPWFYALMVVGFAALLVWAIATQDWLVAALALVMVPVTVAGSRLMRRMGAAEAESKRALEPRKEDRHDR